MWTRLRRDSPDHMLWSPSIQRSDEGEASTEKDHKAGSPQDGRECPSRAQVPAAAELAAVMTMEKGPCGLVTRRWSRSFGCGITFTWKIF